MASAPNWAMKASWRLIEAASMAAKRSLKAVRKLELVRSGFPGVGWTAPAGVVDVEGVFARSGGAGRKAPVPPVALDPGSSPLLFWAFRGGAIAKGGKEEENFQRET